MMVDHIYRAVSCSCGIAGERFASKVQVREPIHRAHHTKRCTNEEPCIVKRILFAWPDHVDHSYWTMEEPAK